MRGIIPDTLYLHRAQLYSCTVSNPGIELLYRKILNTHARIFVNRGLIRFGFGEGSKKYGKCAELYSYLLHDVVRASESSIQQSSSPAPRAAVQHPASSIQQSSRPADTSIQYKHYSHIHHAWTRVKRYQRSFRRLQAHLTVN